MHSPNPPVTRCSAYRCAASVVELRSSAYRGEVRIVCRQYLGRLFTILKIVLVTQSVLPATGSRRLSLSNCRRLDMPRKRAAWEGLLVPVWVWPAGIPGGNAPPSDGELTLAPIADGIPTPAAVRKPTAFGRNLSTTCRVGAGPVTTAPRSR